MNELKKSQPHSPVVIAHQAQRATEFQLRIAAKITAFAGSMNFVYIHIFVFASLDVVHRIQSIGPRSL